LNHTLAVTRQELRSNDLNLKLQAAYKLLFLFNEGIDIQWAAFNVIEMMASNRLQVKRISYTLASLIFNELSCHRGAVSSSYEELQQLLTLTPNAFRKDFLNVGEPSSQFAASLAINCLAKLCNEELASVLYLEVLPLFNCSKEFLRKKTCILSYKLVLHNTDAIEKLVPYLADRLEDPSVSVRISAVTAIHKISTVNPRLFLITIPALFALMVNAQSNWLLIKLIKLLTELCKAEERLLPKLAAKFTEMLSVPKAKSI